jgi:SnoaL-like domain
MSDHIQDIEVLKAKYARFADAVFRTSGSHAAAVALADLFTNDGILDLGPFGRYTGRAQLLNAFETILPAGTAWSTHYIVSPIINVSGSTATGDWYFLIQMVPKSPAHAPVVAVYGSYQDTYEKVGGDWKIKQTLTSYAFPPT